MLGGLIRFGVTMASYGLSSKLTPKLASALGERSSNALWALSKKMIMKERPEIARIAESASRFVSPIHGTPGSFLTRMKDLDDRLIARTGGVGTRMHSAYSFLRREAINEVYFMPAHLTWYSVQKHQATSPEEKERTKSFLSWYFPEQVPYSFAYGAGAGFVTTKTKGSVRKFFQKRAVERPGGNTDLLDAYISAAKVANRAGDSLTVLNMAKRATFEDKNILYALDPRRTASYLKSFRENVSKERALATAARENSSMAYGYMSREPYAATILRQVRDFRWKQAAYLDSVRKQYGIDDGSSKLGSTGERFADFERRFNAEVQGFSNKILTHYNSVLAKESMAIKRWNKYFAHEGYGEIRRHEDDFAPHWELGPMSILSDHVSIGESARQLKNEPYRLFVDPSVVRLGGNMPDEPAKVVDMHRLGTSYMMDSAIRTSGKGIPGFLTSLFGMKEMIQFNRMESQLGVSFESFRRGGNLVFPMAIRAKVGAVKGVDEGYENFSDVINRMIVDVDAPPDVKMRMADAYITKMKGTLMQHPDVRLYARGNRTARQNMIRNEGDRMIDAMLAKGTFPVGKGDTLVHLPGGSMYLTSSIRMADEATQTVTLDLGRILPSQTPLTYLKYTSADSAPTRAIRNFHGNKAIQIGAGDNMTTFVAGPNQTGSVIPEYSPGMFGGKSFAEKFDFGNSREIGLLRKARYLFSKWLDPKNPNVLFSEQYLLDPRGQFLEKIVESSGHNLRSVNDLSDSLGKSGSEMWDTVYMSLLKKQHLTTNHLYEKTKDLTTPWSIERDNKSEPVTFGDLIIKHSDGMEEAGRKKDMLLRFLEEAGKEDESTANFFRDDIVTVTHIGSQMIPGSPKTAGEILGDTRSNRTAYSGIKAYPMSNLDVYNTTVLKTIDSVNYIQDTFAGGPSGQYIFGNMMDIMTPEISRIHKNARRLTGVSYTLKQIITTTDQFDTEELKGAQGLIDRILRGFMGEAGKDMHEINKFFLKNRKHHPISLADADTREKVQPSLWTDTYLIAGSHPEAGLVRTKGDSTSGIMDAKNLSVMTILHAFNRASSEFLDIGFDETRTSTPGKYAMKLLTHRVMPFMGIYMAYKAADRAADYWLDGTPFGEGLGVAAANAVAGARLTAAGVMDMTGITRASKWAEDVFPGMIDSPASGGLRGIGVPLASVSLGYRVGGPAGALTGGVIGSAVGMLVGGGPMGLFGSWNLDKSRKEIIEELTGQKEVPVMKARFWELSKSSFEGDKVEYYRPHYYAMMRAKAERTPGNKDTILTDLVGDIAPDIYGFKNYYSRPYPKTAGLFPNIPIFSNVMSMVPGLPLFGGISMHDDELGANAISELNIRSGMAPDIGMISDDYRSGSGFFMNSNPSGLDLSSDLGFFPGFAGPMPMERSGFNYSLGESVSNIKDIIGLRGFLMNTAFTELSGKKDMYDMAPAFDTPASISSLNRLFYDKNLGGLAGASEIIRRYLPKPRTQIELFNPIRSSMPDWLPGPDEFLDLQSGDPYTKIPFGEARLPGAGYLTLHDVDLSMPITSDILGQDRDSQIGYLLGISRYAQPRNVQSEQAKAIAKVLGRKAEDSGTLSRMNPALYDPKNDFLATVDFIIQGRGGMTPVKVSPKNFGGESALNAFLVMGNYSSGQLIEVDPKNGSYVPRIVRKDVERFMADMTDAREARAAAVSAIPKLESRDKSFNLGNSYSWADRFKILGDVSPYSDEFERMKNIMDVRQKAGISSQREIDIYNTTLEQIAEKKKAFTFDEYRFLGLGGALTEEGRIKEEAVRNEYGFSERMMGSAWEYMTHLRTPINTKLFGRYSALEEYRRTSIYGTKVPQWDNPISDYLLPYAQSAINEDDPFQASLSFGMGSMLVGAAFGGIPTVVTGMAAATGAGVGIMNRMFGSPDLPSRVEERRNIQEQIDAAKYAKSMLLESETGLEKYRKMADNTFTGMAINGIIPTPDDLRKMAPSPDRDFISDIIENVNSSNIDTARALLPETALATLEDAIGNGSEAHRAMREVASRQMERMGGLPGIESTIYRKNVPLYAPAITTYENAGLSAHDGGYGWYKQQSDMNTMKAYGIYAARDSMFDGPNPYESDHSTGRSITSSINLNNALRSRLEMYGNVVISGEGDRSGVIVEIIQLS